MAPENRSPALYYRYRTPQQPPLALDEEISKIIRQGANFLQND
jgi:hypothetical protein